MARRKEEWVRLEEGMAAAVRLGSISIPYLLFTHYKKLKISDLEAMLLLHLHTFIEKERNEFPTIEELQQRVASPPHMVLEALQKLLKENIIAIEEGHDLQTGIQYERYNLDGLFNQLAACWAQERKQESMVHRRTTSISEANLFTIFENEFARPLSPMELETINGWLDEDQLTDELILAALKEAVFAGKVQFRYIDRILLEWRRNRVFTIDQAKEYAQKFRGARA